MQNNNKISMNNKENFIIVTIMIISIMVLGIMKIEVNYYVFLHAIYATFLIAMAVIVFNTINFNREKFSIFLGTVFAIAGIIESIYIFYYIAYDLNTTKEIYIATHMLFIGQLLPVIGILFAFEYFKHKESSLLKKTITLFICTVLVYTAIAIIIFSNNMLINNYVNIIYIFTGLIILTISILSYIKLAINKQYLDNIEYTMLHNVIVLIILSRIVDITIPIIKNIQYNMILNQIILNIAVYYLYKFIMYTNVKKPYDKLNIINNKLLVKSIKLKENNDKLLRENIKIQQLKENLSLKESKLKATLDVSINSIIVFNKDKKITYANKTFTTKFGEINNSLNVVNLLQNKIKNVNTIIDNINLISIYGETKTDYIYSYDNKIYQTIFAPLIINSNQEGVLCILIDKTKKKEFEDKIVQANERYEKFLESIGDGIAVLEDKNIIYTNKACKDIFKDKLYDIKFNTQYDELEREEMFNICGTDIYVQLSFSHFYQNNIRKTIVVIRDITNRKKAQIKLKESQKSYATFIDILPDGICLLDKEFNIEYINQSLVSMLKLDTYKDIKYKNIKKILKLNFENESIFYKRLNEVFLENKSVFLLEHELIDSNEDCIEVEINALPFDIDNNKYTMLIIKDLTHKKTSEKAEKELIERLKTDKIKTEFFANMSHELKTPLNVISSSNQLLDSVYKNNKLEDYNENIESHINLVKQSSYRLHRLINNIIDITKMESGFYKLKLANYNIVSVIEDLFMEIEEYSNKKDISLTFDTEEEEIIMAIDKSEIERIILNLLANCVKFTPNGGNICINIYNNIQFITISVKDTGMGIPKDKIDLVFEEFAQVDKTLSRNTEGSGIGLSIVKNLVELHGGNINVFSEENKGTEFIIKLPKVHLDKKSDYIDIEINNSNIFEKIKLEFSDIYYYD